MCKNCFTSDETGKRSLVGNRSRVKKVVLSACCTVERVGPSDNSKLISSGTRQKYLSSSMDIEDTRLLVVGNSRLDPFLCPT